MSRKGNCWDNDIAESYFHTLKVRLIHEYVYKNAVRLFMLHENIQFELSEAKFTDTSLEEIREKLEQKNALGVANVLRCLYESNSSLITPDIFDTLVKSQTHALYIALVLAAFPPRKYGGQDLQPSDFAIILSHAENAKVIYKALWELRAIVGYQSPDVYINARNHFLGLLSSIEPDSKTLNQEINGFLEHARQDTKRFFKEMIKSEIQSAGLAEKYDLDGIDQKFTPGISLAIQQLKGLSRKDALTQGSLDTLLQHHTTVYTINNNLAHLQGGSNDSLLDDFLNFLKQGAHMVSEAFDTFLSNFTQKIEPNLDSAHRPVPVQQNVSGTIVGFFMPQTASRLK